MLETYVTGSKGFIGRNLVERLDRFSSIPHEDIATKKLEPFDKFFFLSAYGNMITHTDLHAVFQANILDLVRVVEQINPDDLKSFVFVSSSSVKLPTQTIYSRTKKAAEEILLAYAEKYNSPISIVRPFSVTGVGEQPQHLIPTLIRSCIDGEEMPFVGEAFHDFVDVSDLVGGIILLANRHAKGIFELGRGESWKNEDVKNLVEKVTGKKANIKRVPTLRPYDSQNWVSTNFKAWEYGWKPEKTLEQSVTEMVKDYLNAK